MSRRIQVVIGDRRYDGREDGQRVVVAGAACPVCSDLDALVDDSGRVLALCASTTGMAKAMRDHRGGHAQAAEKAPPFAVYSPQHIEKERTIEGEAECHRCRRPVGHIIVQADTIFGLEEDRAVAQRVRSY